PIELQPAQFAVDIQGRVVEIDDRRRNDPKHAVSPRGPGLFYRVAEAEGQGKVGTDDEKRAAMCTRVRVRTGTSGGPRGADPCGGTSRPRRPPARHRMNAFRISIRSIPIGTHATRAVALVSVPATASAGVRCWASDCCQP